MVEPVFPQKLVRFEHNDTYGIDQTAPKSIPIVSDGTNGRDYHAAMAPHKRAKPAWAGRLRDHLEENGQTLANLAQKIHNPKTGDERAEVTLRSWLNGNRQINLTEFLELCLQAAADPAYILFGRPLMREDVTDQLNALVKTFGAADPSAHDAYTKNARNRTAANAQTGRTRKRTTAKAHKS